MAFNITATLDRLQSYVQAHGGFRNVVVGEPKSPPTDSLSAAIWTQSVDVTKVFLGGGTREVYSVLVRVYRNWLSEPRDQVEKDLAHSVSALMEDLLADFELGGGVVAIDPAGMEGSGVTIRWGHVEISNVMFRVVDITLPLIVDDSATLAP